jgi:hypothetical protein
MGKAAQADLRTYYDKVVTAPTARAQASILGLDIPGGETAKPRVVKALLAAGARPMHPAVITAWLKAYALVKRGGRTPGPLTAEECPRVAPPSGLETGETEAERTLRLAAEAKAATALLKEKPEQAAMGGGPARKSVTWQDLDEGDEQDEVSAKTKLLEQMAELMIRRQAAVLQSELEKVDSSSKEGPHTGLTAEAEAERQAEAEA